jgi:hypothetical protein
VLDRLRGGIGCLGIARLVCLEIARVFDEQNECALDRIYIPFQQDRDVELRALPREQNISEQRKDKRHRLAGM